jgi:hypothetical protein
VAEYAVPRIFVSYRRDDSADAAGRIYDRLEAHFGRESVFIDVDTIPFGVDFRKHLSDAVSRCDVLLAIIGDQWTSARYRKGPNRGKRRLDDPTDYVRIEIDVALSRGVPVVPVLVGDASIPTAENLPDCLRDLVFRQATEVRSGPSFRADIDRLIRGLQQFFHQPCSPTSSSAMANECSSPSMAMAGDAQLSEHPAEAIPPVAENPYSAALAQALTVISPPPTQISLTIGAIRTPAELQDLWTIDAAAYGEASITYQAFLTWWEAFPKGLKVLRSGHRILGAVGIWPMSTTWAQQFKGGVSKEAQLPVAGLRSFRRRRCKHWYVSGIVLRPELRKSSMIKTLLNDGLGEWLRDGSVGFPAEILALAYSPAGEALLARFGFLRLQNASVLPDGFPLYSIVLTSQQDFVAALHARGLVIQP